MTVPAPRRRAAGTAVLAAIAFAGIAGAALAGCGGNSTVGEQSSEGNVRLAPNLLPLPAGRTAAYRLPAIGAAVRRRRTVAGLSCHHAAARGDGVHIELYARRLVVPVPAGIGIAPPVQRRGAYVRGGACSYPIRTYEPTGLVVIDQRSGLRLADLFAIWGQPLSGHAITGFRGSVRAYVGARRWTGSPGQIPLRPHAEIVLEVGAFVPPHPRYRFPPGL